MTGAATLPPVAASRLVKLAGMIGSDHDGEALNAARAATRLLQTHGLTWSDALSPSRLPPAAAWSNAPAAPRPAYAAPWRRQATVCNDALYLFSQWERDFLAGITLNSGLSPKQAATLDALHSKALHHFTTRGEA